MSSPESARAARREVSFARPVASESSRSPRTPAGHKSQLKRFFPYESVFKDQGEGPAGLSHISGENLGGTRPLRPFAVARARPSSPKEGARTLVGGDRLVNNLFRSLFRAPRRTGTSRGCSEDRAPELEPSGRRGEAHSSRRFRPVKYFSRARREIVRGPLPRPVSPGGKAGLERRIIV